MKKVIFATLVAGAFALTSCGGSSNTTISKGSRSKLDTLSYSVGVNLASMVKNQISDLPLDYDVLVKAVIATADGSSKLAHEDATATLQDYFMNKRAVRSAEVTETRNMADSVALANGADTTAVREARRAADQTADAAMFEDATERKLISEALGCDLGNSIANAKIPAQTIWVEEGFKDVFAGETKISEMEAGNHIQQFFTVTLPEQNKAASEEWLASIEKKSGVQKTESGILYKVVAAGDESFMPTDDRDVVKVKYTGKTRGGEVFDSSRYADMAEDRLAQLKAQNPEGELPEDGEIIEFPLNRVIKGWTEGMKLVGKGGRISLWIPSDLAYGARGAGAMIGANEALFFDVELIDITPYEAPEAPAATEE
ncbi:MAG: FKBP-type peptidyl-prolyl cis-trans isomerase N-terminal domain-containing protein [Rikenellaceae bacterium]